MNASFSCNFSINPSFACYSDSELMWGQIVCTLVILVGGFGNLLTLRALMIAEAHCYAANLLIMTLCGCDVVFCLLIVPVIATEFVFNGWTFGSWFCHIFPYASHVCVGFSIELFVAIAFNRCCCVCKTPQMYHQIFSKVNTKLIIITCFLLPVTILLPPLMGVWGELGYHIEKRYCTYYDKIQITGNSYAYGMSYTFFVTITAVIIPILAICLAYSKIIVTVFLRKLKLVRNRTLKSCDMKLLATTMSIFATFLICYMPYVVLIWFDQEVDKRSLHTALRLLTIFSPITHPFIYVLTNGQYREAILAYINCRRVPIIASPSSNSLKSSRRHSTAFTSLSRLGGVPSIENFCTTYINRDSVPDEVYL